MGEKNGAHRRVGWSVAAWVATMRTKMRMTMDQVQWMMQRVWGMRMSVGKMSAMMAEAARDGRTAYEAMMGEARDRTVVHLDETSWRENGRNGWVWTMNTPSIQVFHFARSRAGAVAQDILGEMGTGVVVSDFFEAYERLERVQQR